MRFFEVLTAAIAKAVAKSVENEASSVTETVINGVSSAEKTVIDEASRQVVRRIQTAIQETFLSGVLKHYGDQFPGSDYHPPNPKQWMSGLNPERIQINKIVWPGTHDSAECQNLAIYDQLVLGTRLLDIRIQRDGFVCHGINLTSYGIEVVINDIKQFLSETQSEIIILEVRTEYGHQDPPEFDKYLIRELGKFLIHQGDHVFTKTIAALLPKRIICVWKPRNSPEPSAGGPLWSSGYLKDNSIDTNLPRTKFDANLTYLSQQQPASERKFFCRVENTATPVADSPDLTWRIHEYSRLFINQCFFHGIADRLQIVSIDFIDENFVDACVGLTRARIQDAPTHLVYFSLPPPPPPPPPPPRAPPSHHRHIPRPSVMTIIVVSILGVIGSGGGVYSFMRRRNMTLPQARRTTHSIEFGDWGVGTAATAVRDAMEGAFGGK